MPTKILQKIPFRHYPLYLILQVTNLIFPLVSYPYLFRVIGPQKFGLIAVANSISAVIGTLSEYGYSFTGIADTARCADRPAEFSSYLSSAFIIRISVFLICSAVVVPLLILTRFNEAEYTLVVLTILGVLPGLCYPIWLYAGLQRIRQLNYITLINKAISLALLFLLVRSEDDYRSYPVVNLLPAIFSAVQSVVVLRSLGFRFIFSGMREMKRYATDGLSPFISQGLTSLYAQANPVLLMALLHDSVLVGYYATAEKIVNLARSITAPFNQLFLPELAKEFALTGMRAVETAKEYAKIVGFVNLAGIAVLNIAAYPLVLMIAGPRFLPSVAAVRLLSPMMVFVALNNIAGVHVLLNLKLYREFLAGISAGVIANIILLAVLTPAISYLSPSISWTAAEAIVLVLFILSICRFQQRSRR